MACLGRIGRVELSWLDPSDRNPWSQVRWHPTRQSAGRLRSGRQTFSPNRSSAETAIDGSVAGRSFENGIEIARLRGLLWCRCAGLPKPRRGLEDKAAGRTKPSDDDGTCRSAAWQIRFNGRRVAVPDLEEGNMAGVAPVSGRGCI